MAVVYRHKQRWLLWERGARGARNKGSARKELLRVAMFVGCGRWGERRIYEENLWEEVFDLCVVGPGDPCLESDIAYGQDGGGLCVLHSASRR